MTTRRQARATTVRDELYIDGRVGPSAGTGTDRGPRSDHGAADGLGAAGRSEDVDAAVAAAQAAFEGWSELPRPSVAGTCRDRRRPRAHAADELAELIALEVGMPEDQCRRRADPGRGLPGQRRARGQLSLRGGARRARWYCREPVGVVAAITPWNYPLSQIAAKVAPALAAGCTVVVKPSEVAPLNAFVLAEIVARGRAPAGRLQPDQRRRPDGRRAAGRASGRRHGLVHRLDRGPASGSASSPMQRVARVRSSSAASRRW